MYGANGYTGELISRYAHEYGLLPILAGRRKEVIEPLATKLNMPYRIFELDDTPSYLLLYRSKPCTIQQGLFNILPNK